MEKNISRRSFVKGLAAVAASAGIVSILPGVGGHAGRITAASNARRNAAAAPTADGIYILGLDEEMSGKTYDLEFVKPVQLVAIVDGKESTDGTWRTANKHLVAVAPNGVVQMKDGVGGYDVDVTYTLGETVYTVTFHTVQMLGPHGVNIDTPLLRGDFMIRLAKHFGWPHYNAVMDDGTDIDDDGEIMTTERVRNFYDVTGRADYVKPIEAALDMGVLKAESPEDCFYPLSEMTREDAAVILVSAFKLPELEEDYLAGFEDVDDVDPACYQALNTLIGRNFLRGYNNDNIGPKSGISDSEVRICIDNISRQVVGPVWAMPVSNRKFVRCRPEWFTPTKDAVVHWRCRAFNISHDAMKGLFIQDRGVGVTLDDAWGPWYDYIPGWSTDPMFGLNNNHDFPYENVYFCVEVECYATKPGMEDSPHTFFKWRIDRPAWHDFAFDKLHEGSDTFPTIYRFFDNFQAAAYYIEGSEMGILYDGLMPTNTTTTLYDRVKEIATKPFVFVLGHNHPDHNGTMPDCYKAGLDLYVCERCGNKDAAWRKQTYNKEYTSGNPVIDEEEEGTYSGDKVHEIGEGYVFDLGNCKFETMRLPGHEDALIILYDRENGLIFASDIYSVNRYWVADQFGCTGVKQDLVLSLHQQLMDLYTKDGAEIKEVYTGHNRIGMGPEYLTIWEQCLQKLVDYGDEAVTGDRRGDGAVVSKDGDSYETMNWTAFSESGKMLVAEYRGTYDGKTFKRIEVDNRGTENALVDSNLLYPHNEMATLSNVRFRDAELVGHEFNFRVGKEGARDFMNGTVVQVDALDSQGRLKYAIPNKFVPYEFDYEVKVPAGQATVTFTPVSTSNRITSLTVNGKAHSSRCPITVDASEPAVVEVVAPDGKTTNTYTFTFVEA